MNALEYLDAVDEEKKRKASEFLDTPFEEETAGFSSMQPMVEAPSGFVPTAPTEPDPKKLAMESMARATGEVVSKAEPENVPFSIFEPPPALRLPTDTPPEVFGDYGAAIIDQIMGLGNFALSPGGIALSAAGGGVLGKGVQTASKYLAPPSFAVDVGRQIPELYERQQEAELMGTDAEKAKARVDLAAAGLMTGALGAASIAESIGLIRGARAKLPRSAEEVETVPQLEPETIQPKEEYALPVEIPDALPIQPTPADSGTVGEVIRKAAQEPAREEAQIPAKEVIEAAAVQTPEGVKTGANHPEILESEGKPVPPADERNTPEFGFVTSEGRYVTREEAAKIATDTGQNLKEFEEGEPAHSDEIAAPGTEKPIAEAKSENLVAPSGMTGEDFELRPNLTEPYRSVAMIQNGKVIEGKPGDNHSSIAERLGFPKDLIPGFVTKDGKFVYQFKEDVPIAETGEVPAVAQPEPVSKTPPEGEAALPAASPATAPVETVKPGTVESQATPVPATAKKPEAPEEVTGKPSGGEIDFEYPEPNTPESESIKSASREATTREDALIQKRDSLEKEANKSKSGTKKKEQLEVKAQKARESVWEEQKKNAPIHEQLRFMYLEHLVREGDPAQRLAAVPELLRKRSERLKKQGDSLIEEGNKYEAYGLYDRARELSSRAKKSSEEAYARLNEQVTKELESAGATAEEAKAEAMQIVNMQMSYPGMKSVAEARLRMTAIEGDRIKQRVEKDAESLLDEYQGNYQAHQRASLWNSIKIALPNEARARERLAEYREIFKAQKKENEAREKARADEREKAQNAQLEKARELASSGKLKWVLAGRDARSANWVPIEGKPVKLSSDPNHQYFVHRGITGGWSVTEESTGLSVGHGKTQGDAVQVANDRILGYGDKYSGLVKDAAQNAPQKPDITTPSPFAKPPASGAQGGMKVKWASATDPATGSEAGFFTLAPLKDLWDKYTPGIKSAVEATRDAIKENMVLAKTSDFRRSILHWSAKLQRSFGEAADAQREIRSKIKNPIREDGITNWIQAGGDQAVLQQRLDATRNWVDPVSGRPSPQKNRLVAGYEAALNLTPEELSVANDVKTAYDALGQRGQAHDVLNTFKPNYVTQIWNLKRGPSGAGGSRTLKERFRFAKASTFPTFFDGEQAGYTPKTKEISKLLPIYLHEMNSVIASRQLVEQMSKGKASDGRPLLAANGKGVAVDDPVKGQATLILPDATKEEFRDYVRFDRQPALHDWRWATKDSDGNPVFLKADLLVHPEVADHFRNVLGKSAIREWYESRTTASAAIPKAIVRGLDMAQSETKRTMLGLLAPFHQVQEGTHAIGHRVNPFFNNPRIDLVNNPRQMDAARHGLMLLPDRASANEFMEGFRQSALISKIPGIGKLADGYAYYLFHQYIPGIKFKTYEAILSRNTKVYSKDLASGKVKPEDVKILSAEQANAAYGHLNYADLGRNPTIQHLMRLGLLAPDFLEARMRFSGQGIKGLAGTKVGREQILALATLAVAQASLAYISAELTGGEWDKKDPFAFHIGNRKFTLRSVQEDAKRFWDDWRAFTYARLNPLIGRGTVQYLSGTDWRGRKVTGKETTKELLNQPIPLALRPLFGVDNSPLSGWEQLAGTVGLKIIRYSAGAEMSKKAHEWMAQSSNPRIRATEERYRKETFADSDYKPLREALINKDYGTALKEYSKLLETRPSQKVREYMESKRPFTGNLEDEKSFYRSLSEEDKMMYQRAGQERSLIRSRFYEMFRKK